MPTVAEPVGAVPTGGEYATRWEIAWQSGRPGRSVVGMDLPESLWPLSQVHTASGQVVAVRRTPADGPHPQPAVLVHGLGGNATNWTDLAWLLREHLESVAVDLPGFGYSEPLDPPDYSLQGHMQAVVGTIEAQFDQPVHLFGNSMGGAVAVQLAARRPDLVRTLCLVSPALPSRKPRATNIHLPVMTLPRVGDAMFDRYQSVGHARRVQATFDLCFADPGRVSPQRRAQAEAEAQRRDGLPYIRDAFLGSIKGLIASYLDRGPQRPWKLAEQINVPTLLVYGRRDKLVDPLAAHRATRSFPKAHVVVIPDSGHVAQMEHPEIVARAWEAFILGGMPAGRAGGSQQLPIREVAEGEPPGDGGRPERQQPEQQHS